MSKFERDETTKIVQVIPAGNVLVHACFKDTEETYPVVCWEVRIVTIHDEYGVTEFSEVVGMIVEDESHALQCVDSAGGFTHYVYA